MRNLLISAASAALVMLLSVAQTGCKGGEAADLTKGIDAAALTEAKTIFTQRCAVCHGMGGQGDGVGAAALNPKPRNYTDKTWQSSVKDADIEKIIVGGGATVGKSPLMPPNPDLSAKPAVVQGLRAIVRSFGVGKPLVGAAK